jgi:hypothetical protein
MKIPCIWIFAAVLAVALGTTGSTWSQTASESDTAVTTGPAAPSVASKTVTNTTVVNPPPAVVVNQPSTSTDTTTESTTTGQSAGSVQEKEQSKTTYGPKLAKNSKG